jgi:hypothetical protein
MVVPAEVADHVVPHKGNVRAFFYGKLQSLCNECHSGLKRKEEQTGYRTEIGIDGYPIDERHPFNASGKQ